MEVAKCVAITCSVRNARHEVPHISTTFKIQKINIEESDQWFHVALKYRQYFFGKCLTLSAFLPF